MPKIKLTSFLCALIMSMLFLSGCAQLRDKFVRQRDEEEKRSRFQPVRAYDVSPSLDLYISRYVYWHSWHRELLEVLDGTNRKQKTVALQQSVLNLNAMRIMLEPEKADLLQEHIDDLREIEDTLQQRRLTQGQMIRVRRHLNSMGREIRRDFSHRMVADKIGSEFAE